jgi:hypothetical protein
MTHDLSALRILRETEDKVLVFDIAKKDCWNGLMIVETPSGHQVPMRCTPENHPCDAGKILGTVICLQETIK